MVKAVTTECVTSHNLSIESNKGKEIGLDESA